jgi:hypothetical protein
MEHTFIVDGVGEDGRLLHVVDAYYNRTEWGAALPTETYLPAAALERIVWDLHSANRGAFWRLRRDGEARTVDHRALLACNAEQVLRDVEADDAIRRFSRHYQGRMSDAAAMKQFVLACWLVSRARKLHGLWLYDLADAGVVSRSVAEQFEASVSTPWQRVTEFAYILSRRVSQGRSAPDSCFTMLNDTVYDGEVRTAKMLAEEIGLLAMA